MLGLLALLFLVVPIAELYVIVQVTHGIGVPQTIVLLIAISVIGAWLARAAGLSVINRIRRTVLAGKVPSGELVDGGLVLFAGALMITPGFLSDALAILLLLPPSRALVRKALLRRIRSGGVGLLIGGRGRGPAAAGADGVWDVDGWEDPPASPGSPGLGR